MKALGRSNHMIKTEYCEPNRCMFTMWSQPTAKGGQGLVKQGLHNIHAFYQMNDISVYLGWQRGGGGHQSKEQISHTRSLFWTTSGMFFALQMFEALALGAETCKIRLQAHSFDGGPLPPSVYLGRHWRHSCDKMDQAFPLCFCTLQAIKNWMVRRPGNEAMSSVQWFNFSH